MIDLNLKDKFVLVGGGSKGIGFASAQLLAQCGASVTLVARNEDNLRLAQNKLDTSQGQKHQFVSANMSATDEIALWLGALLEQHPIHIVVNNAGGPPAGPLSAATVADFEAAYRQHVLANQVIAQLCLPGMIEQKYGRIINIISTSVKQPLDNLGVSNTTRAAVAGWAKTLANEVAQFGITVNNVLPGATATERLSLIIKNLANRKNISETEAAHEMQQEIPLLRFAQPEEIANAVVFFASPAAAYITGHSLPVDGGRLRGL